MAKQKKQLRTILKGKETGRLKRDEVRAAIIAVRAEFAAAAAAGQALDPTGSRNGKRRGAARRGEPS